MILLLLACKGKDDSAGADDSSTPGGRRFAGSIVDHATGDPIPDADICLAIENTCQQTSTDGSFTLFSDREKDEEFLLLVAEPGWVTLTVPYTVPKGDAPDGVFEMWGEDLVPDSATSATLLVTTVDDAGGRVAVPVAVEGGHDVATTTGEALFTGLADNANATITPDASCTGLFAWEALGVLEGAFRANLEVGRFFSTRLRCE